MLIQNYGWIREWRCDGEETFGGFHQREVKQPSDMLRTVPRTTGQLDQHCFRDSLLTALGSAQAHIWFSYENIRWEGRRGRKKEGGEEQHNKI